jgi:hypothetical protein
LLITHCNIWFRKITIILHYTAETDIDYTPGIAKSVLAQIIVGFITVSPANSKKHGDTVLQLLYTDVRYKMSEFKSKKSD